MILRMGAHELDQPAAKAGTAMDSDSSRLVEDQKVFIFVKDSLS
tara:strand:- start:81 stop:212 length:132 start_codon:yes stop_codon:yes gene_type:complete